MVYKTIAALLCRSVADALNARRSGLCLSAGAAHVWDNPCAWGRLRQERRPPEGGSGLRAQKGVFHLKKPKSSAAPISGKKLIPALILCSLVLASAILLLFTRQKRKLDQAFISMITGSLNIHTHSNTGQIDQAIADAKNTLSMAEEMLHLTGHDNPQAVLARINATHPGLTLFYITAQALKAGPLPFVAPQDAQDRRRRL